MISLDYSENSLNLEDSRAIQTCLVRNKAEYDANKVKEWKERKEMREEEEAAREMYLEEQSRRE